MLVDATSVEVFADGGRVVLTDQIFPKPEQPGVSLFANGGDGPDCDRSKPGNCGHEHVRADFAIVRATPSYIGRVDVAMSSSGRVIDLTGTAFEGQAGSILAVRI